jgi:hypothetical protein
MQLRFKVVFLIGTFEDMLLSFLKRRIGGLSFRRDYLNDLFEAGTKDDKGKLRNGRVDEQ